MLYPQTPLQLPPDNTPAGVAVASIAAIAAIIAFWFLFMNQKIKETDSDIKAGEQKCLSYIQTEVERVRREISQASIQQKFPSSTTPDISQFREEVDSLSTNVAKFKTSLDDVVEISTAHTKIISSMRSVRDWMIVVIAYSGVLIVILILELVSLVQFAGTLSGLLVAYSAMLVFFLFRAKIAPKWARWRKLAKVLTDKGFMISTVPKD